MSGKHRTTVFVGLEGWRIVFANSAVNVSSLKDVACM